MMTSGSDDLPDPKEEEAKRRDAAIELIQGKGGVVLLCEFPRYGELGFDDVVDIAPVSRRTVSMRLNEAIEAGLMEVSHLDSDQRANKTYSLTKTGKQLQKEAQKSSIERLYHKIETLEEELDAEKEDLQSWVTEHLISRFPSRDRDRDIHP